MARFLTKKHAHWDTGDQELPGQESAIQYPIKWKAPKYTISDAFRIFLKRTNGHGWGRIIRARSFAGTVFWFTITCICFAIGIFSLIILWKRYVRYEIETSISTRVGKMQFPSVTVCNNNPIKRSKTIANYDQDTVSAAYARELRNAGHNVFQTVNYTFNPDYENNKNRYVSTACPYLSNYWADLHNLGSNRLVDIDLAGVAEVLSEFAYYYDEAYGNCYTYNPNRTEASGMDNGLHMILKLDPNDYVDWYAESVGARVMLHEAGTMPIPSSDGIAVPRGMAVDFGMSLEEYERLRDPYNDPGCHDDYDNFQTTFKPFKYNYKGCQKTCLQRGIIKECKCADSRLEDSPTTELCKEDASAVAACIIKVKEHFKDDPQKFCVCPHPCKEKKVRVLTSSSIWPPKQLTPQHFEKIYGTPPEHTASVRIYFRSPVIYEYKDIPFETNFQFLGWLGGQLYVWTGASLITLLEFGCFLVTAALVLFTENVDWLMDHD